MTFRDQDSRSRLEVKVRGETETRLSKMCLETVSRTETGLENYITIHYTPTTSKLHTYPKTHKNPQKKKVVFGFGLKDRTFGFGRELVCRLQLWKAAFLQETAP